MSTVGAGRTVQTWSVDQIDPVLVPEEGHGSRGDGDAPLPLLLQIVCHGIPSVHICRLPQVEVLNGTKTYSACQLKDLPQVFNVTSLTSNPVGSSREIQHSLCCGGLACIDVCYNSHVPDSVKPAQTYQPPTIIIVLVCMDMGGAHVCSDLHRLWIVPGSTAATLLPLTVPKLAQRLHKYIGVRVESRQGEISLVPRPI